jgi:hypothetical protein
VLARGWASVLLVGRWNPVGDRSESGSEKKRFEYGPLGSTEGRADITVRVCDCVEGIVSGVTPELGLSPGRRCMQDRGMRAQTIRIARAVTAAAVLAGALSSCAGPDTRREALIDARLTLARVSALAIHDAVGLSPADYADSVTKGVAWPKPAITANGVTTDQVSGEILPMWAGVSFAVSSSHPASDVTLVNVDYAIHGQGHAGGGFNERLNDVFGCVRIGVRFTHDTVDSYGDPSVISVDCSKVISRYFGGYELVSLQEIETAGE